MSCSVVWLKDDFRTSYNQAIKALIEDENKEKKIIYIYEKKTYILCEAQQWWLAKSLEIFKKKLENLKIIEYIKDKYGRDKVSQMITFNTMKGRGSLKDVLRAYGSISFEEMNKITKHIPDEAKIADELQEMKLEFGESSILRWALENNSEELKEWCFINAISGKEESVNLSRQKSVFYERPN